MTERACPHCGRPLDAAGKCMARCKPVILVRELMTDEPLDTDRIKELMRERDLNVGLPLAKCWMTYCRLADEVPALLARLEKAVADRDKYAGDAAMLRNLLNAEHAEVEWLKKAIRGAQLALNEGGDVWTTDHIDPQALSNERLRKRVEELEVNLAARGRE